MDEKKPGGSFSIRFSPPRKKAGEPDWGQASA
jgi:hypothetical protein